MKLDEDKTLSGLKQLFEAAGVHFTEGDAAANPDDQNTDDQNQDGTGDASADGSTDGGDGNEGANGQEPDNPVATDVDPYVDSADQVSTNVQSQQNNGAAAATAQGPAFMAGGKEPAQSPTVIDNASQEDTGVPVDSSHAVDALDPNGTAKIEFEKGNYENFNQMPLEIANKGKVVTNTIMPLIQVALIELLGNNKAYECESFQSNFVMAGDKPTFNVETTYKVENWLGNDIPTEAIAKDANYILNRIKVVPNVNWTKCQIDSNEGALHINFTL